MARIIKRRSKKHGLPPGTLVHIGERTGRETSVSIMTYDGDRFDEWQGADVEQCLDLRAAPGITWVNVEGLHELELIGKLGECHGFHPLTLEDVVNTDQRPKLEDYDDYLYIVLKMLAVQPSGEVSAEQISVVVGRNYVVTFQEGLQGDPLDPVRDRIRGGRGKIRTMGTDYLCYCILDAVVDGYFGVIEQLGDRIEELEEAVVAVASADTVRSVHRLKREMILLRRALWPLREVVAALQRRESPLVSEPVTLFLRDVYDHTIQAIDAVEAYRDILSGLLDIYLSSLSNRMNEAIKFLTIIGTIFIPLTFIAGVYGMNFRYMPELDWRWGYPASMAVMVVVTAVMLLYFKRKKWL